MIDIIKETLSGSIKSVYSMAMIVIPLMVVLQVAKDYHILNKIANFFQFATKLLGISKEAIFPLLVGIFFGISYGAGVIIDSSKEGNLTKKDAVLLVIFLAACHGMIEDTLIFIAIGANGYLLVILRFVVAIFITNFLSKKMQFAKTAVAKGSHSGRKKSEGNF